MDQPSGTACLRRTKSRPVQNQRRSDCAISKSVTQALEIILNSGPAGYFQPRTVAESIALRLVRKALEGDIQTVKQIVEFTEGRRSPRPGKYGNPDTNCVVKIEYVGGVEAFNKARREFEEPQSGDVPDYLKKELPH